MAPIFVECFGKIQDPRVDRTKKHLLLDIIALGLCAVIAGAEGWEEIEDFGQEHYAWLDGFLSLPNGIPHHETIRRVFWVLDAAQLTGHIDERWRNLNSVIRITATREENGKKTKESCRKH